LDALFGHAAASFKTREDGQFYVGKWAESNDLECLLWVKSGSPAVASECPKLGEERKSISGGFMSAFSHKRTLALQHKRPGTIPTSLTYT
jgi:hypothetical protein